VVLFGGRKASGNKPYALDDTWTWNGTTWAEQTPKDHPTARYDSQMAYDAATGQVVLFGGWAPGGIRSDTWTWNGTNWTRQTPATHPPTVAGASMAYDAATGQVVLFGGLQDYTLSDRTWTWNGTTWTEQPLLTAPPPQEDTQMAYATGAGQLVLYACDNADLDGSNSTWTWNGTTWTEQAPASTPPVRYNADLASAPAAGSVVLFGGEVPGGDDAFLHDTWTWNGTTWNQQHPASHPPASFDGAMTGDTTAGNVVLFGGLGGNESTILRVHGTWTWND